MYPVGAGGWVWGVRAEVRSPNTHHLYYNQIQRIPLDLLRFYLTNRTALAAYRLRRHHRARPIGRTCMLFGPAHTPCVHGHRGAAGSAAAIAHALAHGRRRRTAKSTDGIAFMLDALVVASVARPTVVA
jgi:hypothetical protein